MAEQEEEHELEVISLKICLTVQPQQCQSINKDQTCLDSNCQCQTALQKSTAVRLITKRNQGRNEGGKGAQFPGLGITMGGPNDCGVLEKSQQCYKYLLQCSTLASERAQVGTYGRQTCFWPQAPFNLATPLNVMAKTHLLKEMIVRSLINIVLFWRWVSTCNRLTEMA